MNRSIELVTHCFAGSIPVYAKHLLFQASSLLWHPPQADVTLTVFWAGPEHDPHTAAVVEQIAGRKFLVSADTMFYFNPIILPRERLFRRAIGRHMRTQESLAEVLWLADADQYFGEGCIDAVCDLVKDDGRLYGPARSLISKDWQTGDAMVRDAGEWPRVDPATFKWQRNRVLIGGIQVLGRQTARRLGYLGDNPKFQRDADPEKPFPCFRDDSVWRRQHFPLEKQKQVKLAIPHFYRIRHELSSLRPSGFATA